ncbi:mechanosensitive ion channel family protein [Phormidium sp. CCY1219]|uniref:mechanosensitive ion channel family protein n=1 Tax=Phormidium sp. CCY1219 TaxID=2886104 RepID=UPI002D1E6AA5|nr:mechanosensitive ion channel family protein [Phormidium sp. CCY1219]MEB3831324.1 mechanosensitive ion channel family protein [Phormidium sp. CCY1219]
MEDNRKDVHQRSPISMFKRSNATSNIRGYVYLCGFLVGLLLSGGGTILAQEEEVPPPVVAPATPTSAPTVNEPFFADVMVRGRPIFQIGSLGPLSARERAQIINRRISSLIAKSEEIDPLTVQYNRAKNFATLQINNRIIMTVTPQDAEDFGLENVEELATQWVAQLNTALEKPPLAIDVVQRVNGTVRQLLRNTISNFPSFVGAAIVMVFTWLVAISMRRIALTWAEQTEGDRNTEILIGRLGYGAIWVVGSIIALGVLGLDFATLLGALGLTSVAIGFSLKDVLSNYIAGVILLAAHPFRIGDQIVIKDFEGTVTHIDLRATTLTTYDGRVVYIPNQEVFSSNIINNTASKRRRTSVIVGIDYDADIARAKQVILETLQNLDLVEPSPPPEVLVKELAASTVNLEVRFWVDSRRAEFMEMTSQGAKAIKEGLVKAEIELPTEIYTLQFRNSSHSINLQQD